MLRLRGLVFTLLVPGVVGVCVPLALRSGASARAGFWQAGWIAIAGGAALYLWSLLRFLASGGTPAIFFTRHLRFLIGEEPDSLVHGGPYRFSRNPMYLGVLLVVFGQAAVLASLRVALYGACLWLAFHVVVVCFEEPHLGARQGTAYKDYCRRVPRWFGWPIR
ncbi:MAG: isoprenylcysteine carboxylmethyltransferase family protein [Bryobacteraceae bacterium]